MDDGLRLYVLADDETILWQRHFAALERRTAEECFHTACRAFPHRAISLCDLRSGQVLCQYVPLPARALTLSPN